MTSNLMMPLYFHHQKMASMEVETSVYRHIQPCCLNVIPKHDVWMGCSDMVLERERANVMTEDASDYFDELIRINK